MHTDPDSEFAANHEGGVIRIVLPWPPRGLSPNARLHWAPKSKLTKQTRAAAAALAREALRNAGGDCQFAAKGWIDLAVMLMPPHGRGDWDNRIAACKALLDGVADGLGVNDRRFRPAFHFGQPRKGGRVVVDVPWNAVEQGQEREEGCGGYQTAPDWLLRS